jgi:hypothetical protein
MNRHEPGTPRIVRAAEATRAVRVVAVVATIAILAVGAAPAAHAAPGEIPAAWVGRYQAQVVSATSGKEGDAVSTFGKGMTQTTLMLQTQACAQSFTMDVGRSGAISGRGRIMYVYQGSGGAAAMMLAPAAAAAGAGGFTVNLKDGKQFRDWSFTGQVSPDGTVTIDGLPGEPMDLLNNGRWEKHRPWSVLPPQDKSKMRGPFIMKLSGGGGGQAGPPAIRVDQQLQLDDALIKKVRYRAFIVRSDTDITPQCQAPVPAAQKCAASEYLKTKGTIGVDGVYTIESSRDMKSGETSVTSKVGGGEATAGMSSDSSGNLAWEGNAGALVGSTQFNPTDGSYSATIGVGVDTGSFLPGPAKLSEKVEIVYDSACGWGIKGSGGINAGAAGAGVEGAIFFTKAL